MAQDSSRIPEHEVADLFIDRSSTRAFTGEPIPHEVLLRCFEAARWAPSATNAQPWKFIYAHRDSESWDKLLGSLAERNQLWAHRASALVAVLSRKVRDSSDGGTVPSNSHSFDAGAAWSNFAHQAYLLGWRTRAIGGFERDRATAALEVPDDHHVNIFIAIGRAGDKEELPEHLRKQEGTTGRRSVREFIAEGKYSFG